MNFVIIYRSNGLLSVKHQAIAWTIAWSHSGKYGTVHMEMLWLNPLLIHAIIVFKKIAVSKEVAK